MKKKYTQKQVVKILDTIFNCADPNGVEEINNSITEIKNKLNKK